MVESKIDLKNRILRALSDAIDEINEQQLAERRLQKTEETVLLGGMGTLDSLGLITLIVAVEQKIEEEFRVPVVLADEKLMSYEQSPFRTIGTLVAYMTMLLEGRINE